MKTFLLIIPTCAVMLFMSSCAAPFAPFPISLVTPQSGYSSSSGHYSSSRRYSSSSDSAGGIDQTTLNAIDQSNQNNDAANVQNTINSVQP